MEKARRYGGDVNEVLEGSFTGLTMAAWSGQPEMVSMLIREKGARVDLRDGMGCYPLHTAVNDDHPDVARLLVLEHGADPDQVDVEGKTALTSVEDPSMVPILIIELRASVNRPHLAPTPHPEPSPLLRAWCRAGWVKGEEADLTQAPWAAAKGGQGEVWVQARRQN